MKNKDRFLVASISSKVDGYLMPGRNQTEAQRFEAAKAELKYNMMKELQLLDELTMERFDSFKKRDFKA